MTRRYRVEWNLDARIRATTYSTIQAAEREIHRRLYGLPHLDGSAAAWDTEKRKWTTYRLVPGGRTLSGGRMNPVLQRTPGA